MYHNRSTHNNVDWSKLLVKTHMLNSMYLGMKGRHIDITIFSIKSYPSFKDLGVGLLLYYKKIQQCFNKNHIESYGTF